MSTYTLYWTGDRLEDLAAFVLRLTPRISFKAFSQDLRLCLEIAAALAAIATLDRVTGFIPAMRLAYILPIQLGMARGDNRLAMFAALLAVFMGIWTDACQGLALHDTVINFLVRAGVFSLMIVALDQKERTIRETMREATTDPLTGASNRTAVDRVLRKLIDQSLIKGGHCTVAMIDCDHFKDLNDTFGHAYGDQVLKTLVRNLKNSKGAGFVGRMGGDEFVMAFPGRPAIEVGRALDKARQEFSDATLVMGAKATFSFGLSSLGVDGLTMESMFEAADRDMYHRKMRDRHSSKSLRMMA